MVFDITEPDLLLPTSEELPCSDETPVDNENQNTLPNWLLAVLEDIWGDRQDWFFGVDMGIYNPEAQRRRAPFVIPDGFLSIGVQRHKRTPFGRLSYVLREENDIPPILVLEMVSRTYGQEYHEKLLKYEKLGVKYSVLYNPEYYQRDRHEPFELYKLGKQGYELQRDEPYWMEEIGLGMGRVWGEVGGIEREWLAWFDREGTPYPLPQQVIARERRRAERAQQRAEWERQRAEQEQQRAEQERRRAEQAEQSLRLAQQQTDDERHRAQLSEQLLQQERLERTRLIEKLRRLGINPEDLLDY